MSVSERKHRIVVAGAGYAGLHVAMLNGVLEKVSESAAGGDVGSTANLSSTCADGTPWPSDYGSRRGVPHQPPGDRPCYRRPLTCTGLPLFLKEK